MVLVLLVSLAVAFAAGVIATRTARDVALRFDRLDHPDDARKAHAHAVPRVGGIGIATGAVVGLLAAVLTATATGVRLPLVAFTPVVVGAGGVFALGLWDDLGRVGFKTRLLVQAFVAWSLTLAGWHIDLSNVPLVEWLGAYEQAALAVPLTVLWTVGLINAMNLLDGLDGLAGGTALIGFVALGLAFPKPDAVLLALCALGAGASLGFLVYNRAPASVFMGDGGSTLLGFLLAMASVRGMSSFPSGSVVLLPVVALGLPLLDTLTTLARRLADGHSPFLADSDHLHHRALARSGSMRVAVAKLHAMALVFGALAIALGAVAGHRWLQAVVLALTSAFAYTVVGSLGYVRVHDLARRLARHLRATSAARRDLAPRPTAPPRDGLADGRGDGHADPHAAPRAASPFPLTP